MQTRWMRTVIVVACATLLACDDSTGRDTSRDLSSVVITPDARSFTAINDSSRLSAAAKDPAGGTISGITFAWSSLEGHIASVDQTGEGGRPCRPPLSLKYDG